VGVEGPPERGWKRKLINGRRPGADITPLTRAKDNALDQHHPSADCVSLAQMLIMLTIKHFADLNLSKGDSQVTERAKAGATHATRAILVPFVIRGSPRSRDRLGEWRLARPGGPSPAWQVRVDRHDQAGIDEDTLLQPKPRPYGGGHV
jgi:hypothetical protein